MPFGGQKLRQRGHASGGAHRRTQQTRQKHESTAPDARFPAAQARPSARRARNNRKIRPEICPNRGAARNFFKFFKKFSFSVQRTGTKYRVYNIRTLLCTSKCSASRAFLRPHTQNSHPIPCKPVNIRKPAHGLKQIRSDICKSCAGSRLKPCRYARSVPGLSRPAH